MRTLDRYLSAAFLRNFLLAVLGLTAIYLFQALLGELLDAEFPAQQILLHALMGVPAILVQMTPPSVLIGTVLTLSGLNRTNELVACYSLGFGKYRILMILLSIVFMISCVSLILQDRILPPLYKKRTAYYWREMKKRPDFHLDVQQDKIWYRSNHLIYNLRSFDAKQRTIHGMAIYTFDEDFHLIQTIDAERATFTPTGWRLLNGTVTRFSPDSQFPAISEFKEKEMALTETPTDFQEIEKEVEGLRLKELNRYIDRIRAAGADTKSYEVKFHSKISLSFIPLVMCVLGVPFAARNRREGGLAKDLGLCLGVTFFYWLFYSVGLSLGTNGALPPWLAAWLPSAVFAVLASVLIVQQENG